MVTHFSFSPFLLFTPFRHNTKVLSSFATRHPSPPPAILPSPPPPALSSSPSISPTHDPSLLLAILCANVCSFSPTHDPSLLLCANVYSGAFAILPPSPLLQSLSLTIFLSYPPSLLPSFSYPPSFPATRDLLLVVLRRCMPSFSTTWHPRHPSLLPARSFAAGSPSCANVYSGAFAILHRCCLC